MVTEQEVREAAEDQFLWNWGYNSALTIDNKAYPVEWVRVDEHVEGNNYTELLAVFKITIDGFDRYFAKSGHYASHDGEYWDGKFREVVPQPVERVDYVPGTTVVKLTAADVTTATNHINGYGWESEKTKLHDGLNINGRIYPVDVIEQNRGGEGDFSLETSVIFKVGDQIFKKTGHYASHYGDDWDGPITEVKSVQKTVTVWENV